MTQDIPIDELVALAGRLADAAALETLPRFRRLDLLAENKHGIGGFDPVTEADRAAEAAIRKVLSAARPDDGVFGEEEARTESRSGLTWVIDPVDGTRAFISGLPTWGTLIALDDGERGRIGIVDHPFTGERYVGHLGTASRAWIERNGERRGIRVSRRTRLSEATMLTTAPELFTTAERTAFEEIRARARLTRYGTDCYGYALLAHGISDIVIESGLHAYDIAAPKALIEAAGGIVTDWQGGDCRWGGRVLAAATPELHAEALGLLAAVEAT